MASQEAAPRAYIGSFTTAQGPGITVARIDDRTGPGALTTPRTAVVDTALVNPSYLAFSPTRDVLYAVSETGEGAVAAFSLAADPDRPEPLGAPVPVRGDGPTHLALAADGRRLFTANYGSGSVSALPLDDSAGAPGAPTTVLPHHGNGPVPDRQSAPHAHAVVPDPSGRWLLAVDLGTDSVWISALDATTGDPVPHHETALRPGTGPRTLVFHPRGHRAYVLNELDPTLTVCRWDAASGTLEPLGETRVVPPGTDGPPVHPSTPVISPDGRFLWTANRGDDTLSVLALDADGDRPELRATVDCGGHWPRHLTAHGGVLYAANERSGDVTWFTVEPGTGIPRRAGAIAVPAASCVVFA
ncbi:lactonase family protein [Streptomyces sp. AV19]|uniref:lactonase family protein n=1 Tax=Streptomyces sp. AV19 TaxID=2793068 RepID=UPI0018FEE956|nr:lactonase family protein [Streptomyces sp. AV19]MBH1937217.1 lactonase family protein [Streptomyces sp. AV19]MDG4536693.1 lactonase family protein [Streptomyces sp. AV19]